MAKLSNAELNALSLHIVEEIGKKKKEEFSKANPPEKIQEMIGKVGYLRIQADNAKTAYDNAKAAFDKAYSQPRYTAMAKNAEEAIEKMVTNVVSVEQIKQQILMEGIGKDADVASIVAAIMAKYV